jgi:hypothetical protein
MREVNLSSTDKISSSQLSKIMKEVAVDAKKKESETRKILFNEIKKDIKVANDRFIKK